jgi:uncharacterized cupredoxin-like copper-binding protein
MGRRSRPAAAVVVAALCLAGALVWTRAAGSRAGEGRERTVVVTMRHSRFEPALVRVEAGDRVRFVLRNSDPIDHEFILGDEAVQRRHEQGRERHHHGDVPGEKSVAAGKEAATTYAFPATSAGQTLQFACHLPGHYAYGMHGTVRVSSG